MGRVSFLRCIGWGRVEGRKKGGVRFGSAIPWSGEQCGESQESALAGEWRGVQFGREGSV